jgi:hypothetical protein
MSSAVVSSLLIEAPVNRHFAQLHRDPQALTDAVTVYVETGLRRGNGVVVISSPAHTELLFTRLREHELAPDAFLKSGQLELHDPALTLRTFMRNDMPDWEALRRAAGAMFERLRACGRGTTRAYGEMVNMLWQEGNHGAAIRLDEYWSELARLYPFSLFCSYLLDMHHDQAYDGPLEEIGRTHSDILGTSDDEGFRVALDAASRDLLGAPLSQMVGFSRHSSERRFPSGQRTMLWVKRNLPSVSTTLLERARRYLEGSLQ